MKFVALALVLIVVFGISAAAALRDKWAEAAAYAALGNALMLLPQFMSYLPE